MSGGRRRHRTRSVSDRGCCLSTHDHDRLRLFVHEFAVRALIPWAERVIRSLSELVGAPVCPCVHVTSNHGGISPDVFSSIPAVSVEEERRFSKVDIQSSQSDGLKTCVDVSLKLPRRYTRLDHVVSLFCGATATFNCFVVR